MHSLKKNKGYCVICEKEIEFIEYNPWLRDHYKCSSCQSIPRQRALINALNLFKQDWKNSIIHESSPCGQSSDYIRNSCKEYSYSQFFKNVPNGEYSNGVRCENLECLTFEDNSFDIIVTQDVFEHVLQPDLAFKEIQRVLRPQGMHIFTMPWYPAQDKSIQRAKLQNGEIKHLLEPIYHGNPVDAEGALVTFDWGIDFTDFIYKNSGMFTTIYLKKDRYLGLEAEFLEVFVSRKI